jgi:hypothetical protein
MLELEEIVKRLGDRNISEVSRRTKLATPTVWRIAHKINANPRYLTLKKISDYLESSV